MKLLSFHREGRAGYGVVRNGRVIDASARLGRKFSSLAQVLAAGAVDELEQLAATADSGVLVSDLEFALPIPSPQKIFCIGRNYAAYHELKNEDRPRWPSVFARFASSFAAHGQPILKPKVSEQLDYEGELCVVIGSHGRHIAPEQALEHVAGFTIVNEGSVRDWQKRGSQNCPGKNFYRSGSMGPWIVTADEIPDPMSLEIVTRVDGEERQRGETGSMIFSIPELIAHISEFTPVEPGDLIATGSPGGSAIDHDPPAWLRPGQVLEVEIEGIGRLCNPIRAE